jgi:alpha-beta hydrolase superfamily lysophospholipase
MQSVIFIHGMYVTPLCWRGWIDRFNARGILCEAPAWPLHDAAPAELRARHPDEKLARLTLPEVIAHFETIVKQQPSPPVLVGHSMGGLVVQTLLNRGLGAKGVAIDSAPPKGVFVLRWSMLRANFPLFFGGKPHAITPSQWRYAFDNTSTPDEAKAHYDAQAVPESKRVGRGALAAAIDWEAAHPPLLVVGGGADHIIPHAVNEANVRKYKHAGSRVDYKLFDGRTHYTILDGKGWEEVCDFVGDWIQAA